MIKIGFRVPGSDGQVSRPDMIYPQYPETTEKETILTEVKHSTFHKFLPFFSLLLCGKTVRKYETGAVYRYGRKIRKVE